MMTNVMIGEELDRGEREERTSSDCRASLCPPADGLMKNDDMTWALYVASHA